MSVHDSLMARWGEEVYIMWSLVFEYDASVSNSFCFGYRLGDIKSWLVQMAPQQGDKGRWRRGIPHAKDEIRTSVNCYRRLTTPKVQEWIHRIEVEVQEARQHIEEESLEVEDDYWCPKFSTPHIHHVRHLVSSMFTGKLNSLWGRLYKNE